MRSDAQHKASTEIVRRGVCVVVEDLNVGGMVTKRRLARAVSDAGMSGFVSKLRYKCEAHGVRLVQADRWFASTELCCGCGRVQAMPLNVRTYSCDCGIGQGRLLRLDQTSESGHVSIMLFRSRQMSSATQIPLPLRLFQAGLGGRHANQPAL